MRSVRFLTIVGLGLVLANLGGRAEAGAVPKGISLELPEGRRTLGATAVRGRNYVDLARVARAMGGSLGRARGGRNLLLSAGNARLIFSAGNPSVRGRDAVYPLTAAPILRGGRLLVPLEAIPLVAGEAFGARRIHWSPPARTLVVLPEEYNITLLRYRAYPRYTRIVFETARPMEWSVNAEEPGRIDLLIPHGVLSPAMRSQDVEEGAVRRIQVAQGGGGVRIGVIRREGGGAFKAFALAAPHRIVLDVFKAAPGGDSEVEGSDGPPDPRPQTSNLSLGPGWQPRGPDAVPLPPGPPPPGPVTGTNGSPLVVVIDPGHGGHDTGAIGPGGLREKDVVLEISHRLRRLLVDRVGVKVILTREEDVFIALEERTAIANRAKADFFISIHVNAARKRGAVGFETYYFDREPSDSDARASAQRENLVLNLEGVGPREQDSLRVILSDLAVTRDQKHSGKLAEMLLEALDRILKVENRGVKSGPFFVLARAAMPSVLVETAFITNPREERKLRDEGYKQRVAEALFSGIVRFKDQYEKTVGVGLVRPPG